MSDEVVSLFALMDEHLSKTTLNEISDDEKNPSRSVSHSLLPTPPGTRLGIPNFFPGNSPMKDFLAEKISMTLKAKEKQKEEEAQRKIEEEMKTLKIRQNVDTSCIEEETRKMHISPQQEYLIDLTSSIIKQPNPNRIPAQTIIENEIPTRSSYDSEEDNVEKYGQYTFSGSNMSPNDDSPASQSLYSEENTLSIMPKLELEIEDEQVPMTAEEERILKEKQKESLWLAEELRKMRIRHEQEYPPLQLLNEMMPQPRPPRVRPQVTVKEKPTKRLVFDKETCLYKEWDPTLPCSTDISHLLKKSVKGAKCSNFGKVLCAKVRPVYRLTIPYSREKVNSSIVRFDFKTKSPGDIYRENQTSFDKNAPKIKIPTCLLVNLMECI